MGVNCGDNNLQRNKTDQDDAFLLAEKMGTNSYGTAVFKDLGSFRALKLSAKPTDSWSRMWRAPRTGQMPNSVHLE